MPKPRTYDDELQYIEKLNKNTYRVKKEFVPNMKVSLTSGHNLNWTYIRRSYDDLDIFSFILERVFTS